MKLRQSYLDFQIKFNSQKEPTWKPFDTLVKVQIQTKRFPAPAAMRTEDFFGIFKEFQASYKKVKIANIKIGEQRALEAKRRAAAEEKEKERMEAKARKDAGVDDGAVLETLLGNLRSGGLTGKPKRKARERGEARRSGRTSEGLNPKDQAETTLWNQILQLE